MAYLFYHQAWIDLVQEMTTHESADYSQFVPRVRTCHCVVCAAVVVLLSMFWFATVLTVVVLLCLHSGVTTPTVVMLLCVQLCITVYSCCITMSTGALLHGNVVTMPTVVVLLCLQLWCYYVYNCSVTVPTVVGLLCLQLWCYCAYSCGVTVCTGALCHLQLWCYYVCT